MARDTEGWPIRGYSRRAVKKLRKGIAAPMYETRGRRSISQRTRDVSDQLKGFGALFEGTPRLTETFLSVGMVAGIIYLLRPRITVVKATIQPPTSTGAVLGVNYVFFRGQTISELRISYPDRQFMEIFAIASAIIAAPGGGDIGSIVAPIGFGLAFQRFIQTFFPNAPVSSETWAAWDLAAGHIQSSDEPVPPLGGDVTLNVYAKIILPRYLKALMIAAFFYFLFRYVRTTGK